MKTNLTKLFTEFVENEKASAVILVLCAVVSIAITNSSWGKGYIDFWHIEIGFKAAGISLSYSIQHWINDGLMTVFFLLIGLEIERELYVGELSSLKNASLPVIAAVGGMITPALLHFLLNHGTETQAGFGIPIATDIAFSLSVLFFLGRRVPVSIKVFLVSLAIIDDLGAIVVIALFYMSDISFLYISLALILFAGMLALNRLGINRLSFYLIPGFIMWTFILKSGIHASIAGVLLAFAVPFRRGDTESPSYRLEHFLNIPTAFFILPVFALANTGVALTGEWIHGLETANSLGIFTGLFIGKPLGITLFSYLAVKAGLSRLPDELRWRHVIGAGFLGGIGFTMSIFIAMLAFNNNEIIQSAKLSIILGSITAGMAGFLILRR